MTSFLDSLPEAALATPLEEQPPTIDLRRMLQSANFRDGSNAECLIHNYNIQIQAIEKGLISAQAFEGERYLEAAKALEEDLSNLESIVEGRASALDAFSKLNPVKIQKNWKTEVPRVEALIKQICIPDPAHNSSALQAEETTREIADYVTARLPSEKSSTSEVDRFNEWTMRMCSSQAQEASLESASRWAGYEAAHLASASESVREALGLLFDQRWKHYTSANHHYAAMLRAEAAKVEAGRLAKIEAEGESKRLAEAEEAAREAAVLVRFQDLLKQKGSHILDRLEAL